MSSRPRAGRGAAGRDGNREADQENELYTRVIEGLNKANEEHKICKALQEEAFALEQEIKDDGGKPTLAQHQRLDTIYRDLLKHSEEEKKIQDEWNIVDSLAMISAMKASEEPPSRNGPIPKSRKHQRPAVDSDGAPDSPGPSPSETRSDLLKRVKALVSAVQVWHLQGLQWPRSRTSLLQKLIEVLLRNVRASWWLALRSSTSFQRGPQKILVQGYNAISRRSGRTRNRESPGDEFLPKLTFCTALYMMYKTRSRTTQENRIYTKLPLVT